MNKDNSVRKVLYERIWTYMNVYKQIGKKKYQINVIITQGSSPVVKLYHPAILDGGQFLI